MNELSIEPFPFGKRFAVGLVDDTDGATLSAVDPVYEAIARAGLRSTKTVWPLQATSQSGGYLCQPLAGDTLEDGPYRAFCCELRRAGFEIAMHTASAGDSLREETLRAYDFFEATFGEHPLTNVMHGRNRENIYWGKRMVPQPALSGLLSFVDDTPFAGHIEGSPYFWGDICRARTRYVRLFDTLSTNTLSFDPATPFHDPGKPYVNWWFSSSYGAGVRLFELLSEKRLEKLANQRGVSLVHYYARHYAIPDSPKRYRVHPCFIRLLDRLARRRDGWCEPVVKILDRLRAVRDVRVWSEEGRVIISNGDGEAIDDLAIQAPGDVALSSQGRPLLRNDYGQCLVGKLSAGARIALEASRSVSCRANPRPQAPNYPRLLAGNLFRIAWQVAHGRRQKVPGQDPPWVRVLQESGDRLT